MAPTIRRTVLDTRGYIFVFPSLGLRDPTIDTNGDTIPILAAIGTQERSTPILKDLTTPAPLRHPPSQEHCIEIEYQGSVWFLPIVEQESRFKDPEMFTVQVRRVPVEVAPLNPDRIVVDQEMDVICLQPPPREIPIEVQTGSGGVPSRRRNAAQKATKKGVYDFLRLVSSKKKRKDEDVDSDNSDDSDDSGPSSQTGNDEREDWSDAISWSGLQGESGFMAFNREWVQQAMVDLFIEGMRNESMRQGDKCTIKLRVRPSADGNDGDYDGLDYIMRRQADKSPVREEEWQPLPDGAAKEGVVRWCINLARRSEGREEWTKEEWEERMVV